MIMEHLRHLKRRGHWVKAVFRGQAGSAVLPPWSDVKVDEELLLAPTQTYVNAFPDCDVAIVGYFTQLAELRNLTSTPVPFFYWDQGHEQLFGDHSSPAEWDAVFHSVMHLPVALGAVSQVTHDILWRHFRRVAPVIPNAIDSTRFFPPEGWIKDVETDGGSAPAAATADATTATSIAPTVGATASTAVGEQRSVVKRAHSLMAVSETLSPSCMRALGTAAPMARAELAGRRGMSLESDSDTTTESGAPMYKRGRRGESSDAGSSSSPSPTLPAPPAPPAAEDPAAPQTATYGHGGGSLIAVPAAPTPPPADATWWPPSAPPLSTHQRGYRVLLVGNPALAFKNHSTALRALNLVRQRVPELEVVWMCQVEPRVQGVTFPLSTRVNPAQHDVPRVYREGFHCMLFTSVYEAWGMPPMEAMASGIPLVTSRCHGVDMFCHHGYNCLMADPNDHVSLAQHVLWLLTNPRWALRMAKQAYELVRQFTWDNTMDALESVLYQVAYHLSPHHMGLPYPAEHASHQRALYAQRLAKRQLLTVLYPAPVVQPLYAVPASHALHAATALHRRHASGTMPGGQGHSRSELEYTMPYERGVESGSGGGGGSGVGSGGGGGGGGYAPASYAQHLQQLGRQELAAQVSQLFHHMEQASGDASSADPGATRSLSEYTTMFSEHARAQQQALQALQKQHQQMVAAAAAAAAQRNVRSEGKGRESMRLRGES